MRKPLSLSIGVVAVAAGFAVASIVAGGSLGAVKGVWRQLTGTTRTLTTFTNTTYTSTTGGRGIEVCRRFGRGHRHFSVRYVSQQSLQASERGGYRIGPCVLPRPRTPSFPGVRAVGLEHRPAADRQHAGRFKLGLGLRRQAERNGLRG